MCELDVYLYLQYTSALCVAILYEVTDNPNNLVG